MSTENGGNFPRIGARLKEERKRLGFSQEALCQKIGVKDPKTLRSWEAGTTAPTLFDLVGFVGNGFDIGFVLTGARSFGAADAASAVYRTPAVVAAEAVAALRLSQEDADFVISLARRLAGAD